MDASARRHRLHQTGRLAARDADTGVREGRRDAGGCGWEGDGGCSVHAPQFRKEGGKSVLGFGGGGLRTRRKRKEYCAMWLMMIYFIVYGKKID